MKKFERSIKELIGFFIRVSGISYIMRNIVCRNKVTIISYHKPKPSIFLNHIRFLSKRYNLIPLNNVVDAICNKDWSKIPEKALVITLDDGHKQNYQLLNIFKFYNIKPTIYLCSHLVSMERDFLFKGESCKNNKIYKSKKKQLLRLSKKREGYIPKKEYIKLKPLNSAEITEMSTYVDFQSHSRFHPILINCSDTESREEIVESKYNLEKILNNKIYHFSFPNGDYSEREIKYLKNCGYKSAKTVDIGWNDFDSDPYRLKAMGIEDDASINELCVQTIGLFRYFKYLLYGSFNGKHPAYL